MFILWHHCENLFLESLFCASNTYSECLKERVRLLFGFYKCALLISKYKRPIFLQGENMFVKSERER